MSFSKLLISWYLTSQRDLPWRKTKNPYFIWLSEIILQQTRVAQGTPYFLSFIETFPTVFDLAAATEQEVLKLWQGLGYYSRARNLHSTAQYVATNLSGNFPNNFKDLQLLKGVGEYTAAAIASFSFDEVVPVVDGNVYRVLSRYFDIETDIATNKAKKEFTALAAELICRQRPALFNQAMMEFGAMQCTPKNTNCTSCIFNDSCAALQKKKVQLLPVKSKKNKPTHRYFNYLVATDDGNNTLLQKRTDKGIWHNLYEFVLIETSKEVDYEFIEKEARLNYFENNLIGDIYLMNPEKTVHKLTHQHLYIKFWKIELNGILKNGIALSSLQKFPVPIVIHNFIEKAFSGEFEKLYI